MYQQINRKTERNIASKAREALRLLKGLKVPHLDEILDDYKRHFQGENGQVIYFPFGFVISLKPEQITAYVKETNHNSSMYYFHYSSKILNQKDFAVLMAHEGMEKFGPKIYGITPDRGSKSDLGHLYSVLYDREISELLTGKRYTREESVEKICSHFGLKNSFGNYDSREFKIDNGSIILI